MVKPNNDWFTCPVCGEQVAEGALACPHCGSDDETGWSDDAAYDDVDLPDEVFGDAPRPTKQQSPAFAYITVGLVIVIIVVWVFAGY